jgi:hypothetical protein
MSGREFGFPIEAGKRSDSGKVPETIPVCPGGCHFCESHHRNAPLQRLSCVPARVDRCRVLKLVIVKGLALGGLAWHALLTQMRLCDIILRRAAIITPAPDPPKSQ